MAERATNVAEWIAEELQNLSSTEIETIANQEFKNFVTPDICSFLDGASKNASNVVLPPESTVQSSNPENERFGEAITDLELLTAIDKRVPAKTKKSTNWGMNVWREWTNCRGVGSDIVSMPVTDINNHMARFVQEVRRKDGKEYPASSLNNIVAAVQRHLRENK